MPPSLLNYKELYRLRDPLATQPLRLTVRGYSEWLTNEQSWALYKAEYIPTKPIKLGAYQGKRITDFLWTAMPPILCVSSRLVELLKGKNITGWSTYPVQVFDRKGVELPKYYGLAITGPEFERDRSRSEIIAKQAPSPKGKPFKVYQGIFIKDDEWDGSDFFFVTKGILVVSERVRKIFLKTKITNVRLIPLTEVERRVSLDRFEKNSPK